MTRRRRRKPTTISEGDVWKSDNHGFRRVISILNTTVKYSVGADHNRSCRIDTFRRWVREREAEISYRSAA